jgi:hypothetical protein
VSVHVTIEQTPDGFWKVEASDADDVVIETTKNGIVVAVHPDDDDAFTPLKVNLDT